MRTARVILLPTIALGLALSGCEDRDQNTASDPSSRQPVSPQSIDTGRPEATPSDLAQPPTTRQDPATPPPPGLPDFINRGMQTTPFLGFVILGRDEITGEFGAAAASPQPGCGAYVLGARADAGAVAVLGKASGDWRDRALDLLAAGATAQSVVSEFAKEDERWRSIAVLDHSGEIASHRGGMHSHSNTALLLHSDRELVQQDVDAWADQLRASSEVSLTDRLFAAVQILDNGVREFADESRHHRSAALVIARPGGGPFANSDRLVDVRVDYDADPVASLEAHLRLWIDAYVAPRVLDLQRKLPGTKSELYRRNAAWLKRMRHRTPFGQPR